MGEAIKFVQTATISSGGTYRFTYIHDPKGKPSKVGIISVELHSGTQTGDVSIKFGNDVVNTVEIGNGAFTASDPSVVLLDPGFVIHPGQVIIADLATITAGDNARFLIGGH